jgi:hypothetical protein
MNDKTNFGKKSSCIYDDDMIRLPDHFWVVTLRSQRMFSKKNSTTKASILEGVSVVEMAVDDSSSGSNGTCGME